MTPSLQACVWSVVGEGIDEYVLEAILESLCVNIWKKQKHKKEKCEL